MRALRLWPLVVGLLLVTAFSSLELRGVAPARASFTLVGLLDCGLTNGRACSIGDTLVLVSNDSGTPTRYTISLAWLKSSDLPDFEQDGEYSVELEKLPDGTLVAVSIVDVSNRSGVSNPGTIGAKTATANTEDDRPIEQEATTTTTRTAVSTVCIPGTTTAVSSTTTTLGFTTDTTQTARTTTTTPTTTTTTVPTTTTTTAITTTTTATTSTSTSTVFGPLALITVTTSTATTLFPCGTTATTTTATGTQSTTATNTSTITETATSTETSTSTATSTSTSTSVTTSTSIATTTSVVGPDLRLTATDSNVDVAPGASVTYYLSVYNDAGPAATGVTLTATVPANMTFQFGTPGWSCSAGAPAGTVCTYNISTIGPGNAFTNISFVVQVNSPLPPEVTEFTLIATVEDDGSKGPDANPANNTATETTPRRSPPPP